MASHRKGSRRIPLSPSIPETVQENVELKVQLAFPRSPLAPVMQELQNVRDHVEILIATNSAALAQYSFASAAPALASPVPALALPTPALASAAPALASPVPALALPAPALASLLPALALPTPALASAAPALALPTPALASAAPALASAAPAIASPVPALASAAPVLPLSPCPPRRSIAGMELSAGKLGYKYKCIAPGCSSHGVVFDGRCFTKRARKHGESKCHSQALAGEARAVLDGFDIARDPKTGEVSYQCRVCPKRPLIVGRCAAGDARKHFNRLRHQAGLQNKAYKPARPAHFMCGRCGEMHSESVCTLKPKAERGTSKVRAGVANSSTCTSTTSKAANCGITPGAYMLVLPRERPPNKRLPRL